MSDDANQPSSSNPQTQSQNQRRPAVLFASLPGIKIITPPKGQFSPKVDERCITFCSQTISGRIHHREPECYSLCIRNVFMHEVRNVVAFKSHRNVDSNGCAKYPLPPEGQERHEPVDTLQPPMPTPKEHKYWEEGLYVWISKSRWAAQDHMSSMSLDLAAQKWLAQNRTKKHAIWKEYQDYIKKQAATTTSAHDKTHDTLDSQKKSSESNSPEEQSSQLPSKWWGPIVPPHPGPDLTQQADMSLLIHPVAPVPVLYTQVKKLLEPSVKLLDVAYESVTSGTQKKFWLRVWNTAFTKEPFVLADRTIKWSIEKFTESESDSDSKS